MTFLITAERLLALCANARADLVQQLAPALEESRARFGVTAPGRVFCCVAQIAVESAGFRRLEENLSYSADRIAQVLRQWRTQPARNLGPARRFGGKSRRLPPKQSIRSRKY